jgi:hypothetical protein
MEPDSRKRPCAGRSSTGADIRQGVLHAAAVDSKASGRGQAGCDSDSGQVRI